MPETAATLGWEFLCHDAALVMVEVDVDGLILFANRCARELTGLSLVGSPCSAMLVQFSNSLPPCPWRLPVGQRELLHVVSAIGSPHTLYFTRVPHGSNSLLFGQVDLAEEERLHREVLALNQELSSVSRELAQKNAELRGNKR